MQFIGTGDRILTENFNIGYLYTITFTNGVYINSACIGKGDNFVMFQRTEPDLIFNLNVESVDEVSTIELYDSGGGTNDYDDLSNKPLINNITLSGNKSSSDLGLQDTISDIATIRSGAAAGATAVQPADMTTALATKQDALSAAQLDAVNSGITSTDVAQITANKNNILLNWGGAKNLTTITGGTTEVANRYIINNQPLTLAAGEYVISFKTSATTGANAVSLYNNNNDVIASATIINSTGTVYTNISIAEESAIIFVYATVAETITEFMICTKADWEKSPVYAPYAMTNVELTAAIQAIQAQLANQ